MSKYSEKAENYFKQGYNCAQSVVATFCEEMNMDFETAMKISSSFGGGMGRLREVCGAVTGMFIVTGIIFGYDNPSDKNLIKEHYELIQTLAFKFKEKNQSIICKELLGLENQINSPVPTARNEEFYKKRPCLEFVKTAADLLGELINQR